MKTTNTTSKLFLSGITVFAFILLSVNLIAGGNQKEKSPSKPWTAPEQQAKTPNPIKPEPVFLATGKDLWEQNCKSCHGRGGRGDGSKAKNLDVKLADFTSDEYKNRTDGELYWKIEQGHKPMPAFKTKLSDIETWAIILYTRTFSSNLKSAALYPKK